MLNTCDEIPLPAFLQTNIDKQCKMAQNINDLFAQSLEPTEVVEVKLSKFWFSQQFCTEFSGTPHPKGLMVSYYMSQLLSHQLWFEAELLRNGARHHKLSIEFHIKLSQSGPTASSVGLQQQHLT